MGRKQTVGEASLEEGVEQPAEPRGDRRTESEQAEKRRRGRRLVSFFFNGIGLNEFEALPGLSFWLACLGHLVLP